MKLAFFDDFKLGVVTGDMIVDVSGVVSDIPRLGPQDVMRGVIEKFESLKGKLADAAAKGQGKPVSQVKFRPPLPKPENIVCMAVNYMEDGTLPEPAPINAFNKSPSAVIGDGDTMVLPDMAASVFEGEAEIALVIGKRASNVKAADAMGYVFGYTNFIDGSARGVVPPTNVFYQMKSRDTFAPIGPYIVTADEIKDPQKLQIKLTEQRRGDAEFQHRRHGAQDSALHRMGHRDPRAGARRHSRDRHQPPRAQPVHGRRQDRTDLRGLRHAAHHRARRSQAQLGPHHPPCAQAERSGRRTHQADRRQIREVIVVVRAYGRIRHGRRRRKTADEEKAEDASQ